MQLPDTIFREYDIRGIAGKDLTEDVVELVGKALSVYLCGKKKHNCVAVGRDGRLTSKGFANALIDGLTSAGMNVIDIGETSTGVTYYSLFSLPVDGGVMITGSHNPKEYNGLKIGVGKSTIHGSEIQKIKGIMQKGVFPVAKKPVTITRMDLLPKYQARIARDVKLKRKLKIVVDAGNGVGGKVGVDLFRRMGCEVIELYCDVDGNFPNHHPDPTLPETLKTLVRTVKKEKADLGIGFDGDADRIGAVDDKGNFIAGDMLLLLFARHILKEKKGAAIVGEVKCSRTMYDDIRKNGGNAIMWKAGHSLIKDCMVTNKAQLGGEMSGHIFFKHRWYGFDCAIYAAARLLEIIAAGRRPFHKHLESLPKTFATEEIRLETTDTKKFKIVEQATAFFVNEGYDVNTIDGARIEFPDGWGLLRVSNTSPMIVMRCEAETKKRLNEIRKLIEGKFNELK